MKGVRARHIIGLIFVLMLAAGLRWYHFNTFPPGLWFDEAHHLNGAQAIALGNAPPQLYYPVKTGEPAIYWLTAVALKLGAGHLAPRWVAAIGSLVGLVLIFFASRDVLRRRYTFAGAMALWSTAVVATNYFYLFNSRMGWEPVLVTAISIPTIWLFWRGLVDGRRIDFFASGVAVGASQYVGVIARSLPIVLLLLTVTWLGANGSEGAADSPLKRSRSARLSGGFYARRIQGLIVAATSAIVVYLPLAMLFLRNPGLFAQRLETSAGAEQWLGNLGRTLGGFIWLDEQTLHRLVGRPLFDWPIAILLIMGTAIALWRWRQPVYAIWLAWVAGFLPGAMMSAPAPVFYRYLPTIPAAAVLSSLALAEAWRWAHSRKKIWQMGVLAVAGMVLALSLFLNSRDYFQRWPDSTNLFSVMDVGKWTAAEAILTADEAAALFVTMPANVDPAVSYAIQTRGTDVRPFDGHNCVIFRDPSGQPLRIVAITGYENRSLAYFSQVFPQGVQAVDPIFGGRAPYFTDFLVPAGSSMRIQGALPAPIKFGGIDLHGVDAPAEGIFPGSTMPITLTWQANRRELPDLTAFVHLLGSNVEDPAPLKAQHDGIPCTGSEPTTQWQPGEFIVDEHLVTLPPDLAPGRYLLGVGLYQTATLQTIPPAGDDLNVQWGEAIVLEITVLSGNHGG